MVLTEVLQNALEHAFPAGERGSVEVAAVRGERSGDPQQKGRLLITIQDDGCGLPEGFDPQRAGNLGLQIVRTLVEGELGGVFDMLPVTEPGHGTRVVLDIPVSAQK